VLAVEEEEVEVDVVEVDVVEEEVDAVEEVDVVADDNPQIKKN
jgi:hypothetical protein